MKQSKLTNLSLFALLIISVSSNAHAILFNIGNGLIYDAALNVTWLQDANYARTSAFDADGLMSWVDANAWADSLDYKGITGWRLPTMVDTGASGCDFSNSDTDCGYNVQTVDGISGTVYSEMAYMFHKNLGNLSLNDTSGNPQSGYGVSNMGEFFNLENDKYWSAVKYTPAPLSLAWLFRFGDGRQEQDSQSREFYAWAVHDGDISASVSVPASSYLVAVGLMALLGWTRKRVTSKF